ASRPLGRSFPRVSDGAANGARPGQLDCVLLVGRLKGPERHPGLIPVLRRHPGDGGVHVVFVDPQRLPLLRGLDREGVGLGHASDLSLSRSATWPKVIDGGEALKWVYRCSLTRVMYAFSARCESEV